MITDSLTIFWIHSDGEEQSYYFILKGNCAPPPRPQKYPLVPGAQGLCTQRFLKHGERRGSNTGLTARLPSRMLLPQSADWAMTILTIQCSFQCKNLAVKTATKHASSQGKLRTTYVATAVLNTILTFMVQAVNSILAAATRAAGGHQL